LVRTLLRLPPHGDLTAGSRRWAWLPVRGWHGSSARLEEIRDELKVGEKEKKRPSPSCLDGCLPLLVVLHHDGATHPLLHPRRMRRSHSSTSPPALLPPPRWQAKSFFFHGVALPPLKFCTSESSAAASSRRYNTCYNRRGSGSSRVVLRMLSFGSAKAAL
jgi:hypothetical protein